MHLEDSSIESGMDCISPDQEASEGMNIRHNSWDILAKNVAAFYSCPKNLPQADMESFGLMSLAEEISIQTHVNSVMWLLMIALTQIYNEKEQASKEKKKKTKKYMLESTPFFKETKV